jgi:hypothetical protein
MVSPFVFRHRRVQDLFHTFHQGRDARIENDHGNDQRAQVLITAMAEGMLEIRIAAGQLGPCHRNDRRKHIGQVVHRIHQNGNGMGGKAHHCLEAGKQEIHHDADQTGAKDHSLPLPALYFSHG